MQQENQGTEMTDKEINNKLIKAMPTPKELHKMLDEYVIGQDDAKRTLSVGIYNHWKRVLINKFGIGSDDENLKDVNVEKSNIMLLGKTGTGKTYMVKTIARMMGLPCYIGDSTRLTSAGYVGDDIETVLTGLLQECNYDVKAAEMGIVCIDEADKLSRKGDSPSLTRDVGGESVQQGLLKIVEGSVVGVPPQGGRKHPEQPLLYVDTSNILFIFMGAFDGLEKIIERRTNTNKIGFTGNGEKEKAIKHDVFKDVTTEDLKKYGFIPELIGRFPIVTSTEELTKDDLVNILSKPKNSLLKQYQKLLLIDGIKLSMTNAALEKIAEYALSTHTGARGLKQIMEKVLGNVMYDFSEYTDKEVKIDKTYITNILQNKKAA
jgi:ATP-dependent Clp protease ATP-binding subunit ClpX